MSIRLPAVDLSTASVGTTGQVTLPQPKVQVGELAHLRLYNESGCGVSIAFSNGHTEAIPAGAWPMFEIEPEVQTYTWTVTYVLPNAPVSLLEGVYYFPNEGVPPTPALGNSPIGITGGVTTSSVQTLSQEGQAKTLQTIDIGDSVLANLLIINNDGTSTWKVDVAGVAHTVLAIAAAANFLKLGQASDTVEVLGSLAVDGSVKTNTLRDNSSGVDLIDLAATLVTINQAVSFLAAIQPNLASTVVNGSVSGSATFYAPIWGSSCKIFVLILANYNNAGVATFNFASSVTKGFVAVGNLAGTTSLNFRLVAAAANTNIITALAAAGGSQVSQAAVNANSIGILNNAADNVQLAASTGAASTAAIFIGQ